MNHEVESNMVTSEAQMLSKEMNTHIEEMQLQNAASAAELSMHSSSPVTAASNNRRKSSACDICGKVFSRYDNLERHRRTHQGEKLYNCDVCGKSFAQSSYLKVHYRTHSGERPFKCNICGYAFSRSDHLVRHVRTHHLSRQISDGETSCANTVETVQPPAPPPPPQKQQQQQQQQQQIVSSQCFPTSNNNPHLHPLTEPCNHHSHPHHVHSHHQPNYPLCGKIVNNHSCTTSKNESHDKDLKCASGCAGNTSSLCQASSGLQHHMSPSHPGTGLFNCDVCWKAFSQTPHGNIHKRIHAAVLPYQCQICGKSFSRRDNLKRHISTHDGLKSFSCEVCSKAFSRRAYLKVHHRIHTGERPYKCSICDYAFTRNDHLIRHNRPNKGERKFSCIPLHLKDRNGCAGGEPQQQEQNLSSVSTTCSLHTSNQNLVLSAALSSDVAPASVHHMMHTSSSSLSSPAHHHAHHHHHHHHPHHAATCVPIAQIFPTIQMSPVNPQIFPSVQMSTPQSYSLTSVAPHNSSHKDRHPPSSN